MILNKYYDVLLPIKQDDVSYFLKKHKGAVFLYEKDNGSVFFVNEKIFEKIRQKYTIDIRPTPESLIIEICELLNIKKIYKSQKKIYVFARCLFYFLMKKIYPEKSLSDIGWYQHQDHATVLHGIKNFKYYLENTYDDGYFFNEKEKIIKKFNI